MSAIPLLAPGPVSLPAPQLALDEPDGLLAAGGSLSVAWLLAAYAHGIFPWFDSDDDHILWWSPSMRAVLHPGEMRVTRSLAKRIRNAGFRLSMDEEFDSVMFNCSKPRRDSAGTWITPRMLEAYHALFEEGFAHSVEVWRDGTLCGGLYGVSIGTVFCGESMFSAAPDASKVAFHALQRQLAAWQFNLIDCQIINPHLASLAVTEIPREAFLQELDHAVQQPTRRGRWRFDEPSIIVS